MEAALAGGGRGAPPADRLPSQVVTKTKETLTIDGVKLELLHWVPAHTSGDLVVYLPDQKIVFAGDITTGAAYVVQTNRPNPLIHAAKMGSSEGWITTVKGMLALNADQYVPGHGDLQTKADIQAVLKATEEKRAKIPSTVKEASRWMRSGRPPEMCRVQAQPEAGVPPSRASPTSCTRSSRKSADDRL